MQITPTIRAAELGDLETLVGTLSKSFARDPLLNWVFPPRQLHPEYFRLVLREVYFPRGMVHMENSGCAAALWLPPQERFEMPPRLSLLRFFGKLVMQRGPGALWRIHKQHQVYARYMPKDPHYYLQFIGCDPEKQGEGIGAALLESGTRICDEREMPAYLESSNERNVPLYQRHGFEVVAQEQLSNDGPTVWFMWREPR